MATIDQVPSSTNSEAARPAAAPQAQPNTSASMAARTTSILDPANFPQHLSSPNVYIELRYTPLDTTAALRFTRSPSCGANVLFLGTTRNNFDNRPVTRLSYSAYPALALKSLFAIAEDVRVKHGLEKVYIAHRLGEVDVEEESIAVSVSSGHRGAGWRGAEEMLERVKKRAEIWKREWFADTGEGDWRANRDRDGEGRVVEGVRVADKGKGRELDAASGESRGKVEEAVTTGAVTVDAVETPTTTAGPIHRSLADEPSSQPAASTTQTTSTVVDEGELVQPEGDDGAQWPTAAPTMAKASHQTSKELDSDVADYIAAMTAKLRM